MTGAQVREARRLLGWSTERLAALCNVSANVIQTFETTGRVMKPVSLTSHVDRLTLIRSVLETAGVVLIPENAGGAWVRLRKPAVAETPLEQCQRHVTEGSNRIARQEVLIVELVRDGHEHMLPNAYALLENLKAIQCLGVEHLAREIAKSEVV